MKHLAYPTNYPLVAGVQLSILVSPIKGGDELAIEYPNGRKALGKVMSGGPSLLEVVVGKKRFRLAPLAFNNKPEAPIRFLREPVPVWVVQ